MSTRASMASNRPTSVRPATGLSQTTQAHLDDLQDRLILEQARYKSLAEDDSIEKTDEVLEQIAALKSSISLLKKQVADARSQSRASAQPNTSTSTAMDSYADSRSGTPSHDRKRSFGSSYLNGAVAGRPEAKSRKPTPTPSPWPSSRPSSNGNPFSIDDWGDIPCIDLTGVDDEEDLERVLGKQTLTNQRAELERIERNQANAKRDAEFARRLQQTRHSPPSSHSPHAQTPAPHVGSPYGQPSNRALPILSSSRANQGYHVPPTQQESGFVQGSPSVPWARNIVRPESVAPRPSIQAESTQLPSFIGTQYGQQRMPGSFDDSDSDNQTQAPQALGTVGRVLHSVRPLATTIEQTRQAALAQANQPQFPMGPQGYAAPGFNPSFGAYGGLPGALPGFSRPGYLSNGSYLSQQPLAGPSHLNSLINRHNSYNFQDLTELPDHIRDRLQDIVEDPRKTSEEITELLSNIRPDMDIPVEERHGTPDAMKYPLYTHQQVALTWMTKMEEGSNKGGILADDMGLGKTISSLALMVSRQSEDKNNKTNLIIGPVALITQWQSEIKKKLKTSHRLLVVNLKKSKKLTHQAIKSYDVVLTTYGSIAAEWKRYEDHVVQYKEAEFYDEAKDQELLKKCPMLHPTSRFYRIILDEAQCIKNKDSQTSKGCSRLTATYRWCLTGTPIMNQVTELYPLIRFLHIRPYSNFKDFSRDFKSLTAKPGRSTAYETDKSMEKLRVVLQAIMLRRNKNTMIDGKPIITLKPKTHQEEYVTLSPDELGFYRELETKSRVMFNRYLRAGTVGKNYSNILVLLLRLRQACCHPHLIDFEVKSSNEVEGQDPNVMLDLAKTLEANVVERIKAIEAFECPICYDAVDDPTLILPCGHDTCMECFASLTSNAANDNIRTGNENGTAKCPVCRGSVDTKKIINYTAFQKVYMPEKVPPPTEAADHDSDEDDDISTDSGSDVDDDADSVGSLEDFIVNDDEIESDDDGDAEAKLDAELAAAAARKKKMAAKKEKKEKKEKKKAPKPAKAKKKEKVEVHQLGSLRKEAGKNKDARRRYMHFLRDNWEDSAKVTKVVELVKDIQETGEKTIIFSQWTSLLDMISVKLKYSLHLKHECYTGAMSTAQRDAAVEQFVNNPYCTVMLVSLRAGNAGLNLTVASRVIIMDPFWNPFIENQAVDRAHRIGQQREVKIHRILVKDTVEDRIIELQEKKRELVSAALNDEGQMRNVGRLSQNELRYLFGVGRGL